MFYSIQQNTNQKQYQQFLSIVGNLSNLFSDSDAPYLYYRIAEKIFCRAFNAEDLSRSDVSADAKKDNLGIGLKTFLVGNNKTFQKVAEFNVDILRDPLIELQKCFHKEVILKKREIKVEKTIFLPLYGRKQTVFEKSGLNQWNARGRVRHHDEVYVPVPIIIHRLFPDFFPDKYTQFNLKFPDGEKVIAKICQDNKKALMTHSNRKLGKLILRDGLKLNIGELATYDKLQLLGIDSVRIDRINKSEFEINFTKNGSYEEFISKNT